jgi:hypothetical protein
LRKSPFYRTGCIRLPYRVCTVGSAASRATGGGTRIAESSDLTSSFAATSIHRDAAAGPGQSSGPLIRLRPGEVLNKNRLATGQEVNQQRCRARCLFLEQTLDEQTYAARSLITQ